MAMQTCFYTQLPSCEFYHKGNGTRLDSESSVDEFMLAFTSDRVFAKDTSGLLSLEVEDHSQQNLDVSLKLNKELHTTLQLKQEEISALREKNAQLKELARQAEHSASILHALTPCAQSCPSLSPSQCVDAVLLNTIHIEHMIWHGNVSGTSERTDWIPLVLAPSEQTDWSITTTNDGPRPNAQQPQSTAKRKMQTTQHELVSNSMDSDLGKKDGTMHQYHQRDAKRPKLDKDLFLINSEQSNPQPDEVGRDPKPSNSDSGLGQCTELSTIAQTPERVNICGAFRGLRVVMATPSVVSEPAESCRAGEGMCFKTSVRDHSTVRTQVFPVGTTFTSHTPSGACRFLWVPNQS